MPRRVAQRLGDIQDAIEQIGILLNGKSLSDVTSDKIVRAAFERFLEIISEASKHIPELTAETPEIPWQRIRGLGNLLRHAYNRIDPEALWTIHADGELAALLDAVTMLINRQEPQSDA